MIQRNLPETYPHRYRPLADILCRTGEENGVYGGNNLEIIISGQRKRELLLEDIRRARSFIHIEYYRFGSDSAGREVGELLLQKAAEGVEVRILNNNFPYLFSGTSSYFRKLARAGVEVIPFTHICHGLRKWLYRFNHQMHRKVVVIDGQVAYTGGMNLNDNYFYKWRDTHLRITGPAVTAYNASFMESWKESGGRFCYPPEHYTPVPVLQEAPLTDTWLQLVSDSPEKPGSAMLSALEWILKNAQKYVYIQTPYFVPPKSLMEAFADAVKRGVDVCIMMPRKVDTPFMATTNRAYYDDCLKAGVRILEKGGAFIHSKTLVADDEVTVIGSSNLDWRSFYLNYELNTLIIDPGTALRYKDIFDDDARQAQAPHRSSYSRFMRLFYRLL